MPSAQWPETTVRDIRLFEVSLPLREPFQISGGSMALRHSYIVEMEDALGNIGWGESAPFEAPFYSEETLASVRACLEDLLIPRVVGRTVHGPEGLHALMSEGVRGNRMARAGVDTAYWDLLARRESASLASMVSKRLSQLGVPADARTPRPTIECGLALGIPESGRLEDLAGHVINGLRAGFRRVKIKVRPGWDADAAQTAADAIRSFGSSAPLWADANGAFDIHHDRRTLERLDAADLLFLEQPFQPDALWDLTVWNRSARVPVCLDETLVSDEVARQVVEMGGPLIWNLKIQRLGGLEEASRVYARGVRAGARMWVGTMPETGLGAQAALAIACLPMAYPSDVEPSDRWYREARDVVPLTMSSDGLMEVPQTPPVPRRDGWTELGRG